MSATPLLSVEGLSASVDEKTILHGIDLAIPAGETHVLMGPNGAGKSTLGHVIMGDLAYTQTSGSIRFDGEDITDLSTDKRSRAGIFLSFQAPVEIPGVPLSSFLRATLAGRPGLEMRGKEFRRRMKELCAELDMPVEYLNRELGVGFSGGEKKKVEMLQLLLLQPKLAILDETDSGLDVDALGVVSRGMDLYRKRTDGTLLIITHNTRILEHLDVDRVHVMVGGRLVHDADASLIDWIDEHGFERFEAMAAEANAAEGAGAAGEAAGELNPADLSPVIER
ncbi:Fe-S cluster assembly ATPase SufC [uncultured Enorma sp.]|uniref:Fe-S cluster assembly ATPase SufC n=1 Tax=uncultured Enorma sp. TaxID=1714346 RepID=UPI002598E879|nr:Fe-S cluster assembly ATPase SufC [uncultured Enorma sp.]